MKVYIILDEEECVHVGTFVEKVFSDREKAIDYLYGLFIKNPFYVGKSKQDLSKEFDRLIHEAEVE
jgi:hypothetical protein